jgi:NACalpha-BTF3-like transcription factor
MYIQENKHLREEWFKKKYEIKKEDIELIMQNWDAEWKFPSYEQEIETSDIEIEELSGPGNDERKKRKDKDIETEQEKLVSHQKKRKARKDTSPLALTEDDFNIFGENIKDITNDVF